jgi:hypothetical protein
MITPTSPDAPMALPGPVNNVEHVAAAVPAWLAQATPEQRSRYNLLARRSLESQVAVQRLCSRFEAADYFIENRLAAALAERFGVLLDLRGSELITLHYPLRNPNWEVRRAVEVQRANLLRAAMANFTEYQADGGFEVGSVILPTGVFKEHASGSALYDYDSKRTAPITPSQFAQVCRGQDFGAQYQRHFDDVFVPKAAPVASAGALQLNLNDGFALAVQRAVITQAIDADAGKALQALLDSGTGVQPASPAPRWNGQPLVLQALRLLVTWVHDGTSLQRAAVFTQNGDPTRPCVAYLPGDALHVLKQYPSLQAFSDALRERLRTPEFRLFCKGFVALSEQAGFLDRLVQTLNPGTLPPPAKQLAAADPQADIGLRTTTVSQALPLWMHSQLLEQMRNDAQTLLVPNAVVDSQVTTRRWQTLLTLGLDGLQVVAGFVPALGLLMVGAGAVQLLAEAFIGIDDWTHGQRQDALKHLLSVAENAAIMGVTLGVGVAIHRSSFVEGMLPVLDRSGRTRLLDATLDAFVTDLALPEDAVPNALGQYVDGSQHYIKLDGQLYRVALDAESGQWQIRHPSKPYRLALRHNGQGAWRAAHEQPSQWTTATALRRLGPVADGLDAATLEQARQACGLSEANLLRIHRESLVVPAALRDTLNDFRQLRSVGALPEAEQAQAFQARQQAARIGAPSEHTKPLLRDFPNLSASAAEEIVANAKPVERRQLTAKAKVGLRLAEQARMMLRERRLNLALAGLLWPEAQAGESAALRVALATPGDDDVTVFQRAVADRAAAAKAIGQRRPPEWWRPPVRLPQGHLGYPLSGRGAGQAPVPSLRLQRLRRLYPQASDELLQTLHDELGTSAPDLNLALRELEYQRLGHTLDEWANRDAIVINAAGNPVAADPADRLLVRSRILETWRRESGTMASERGRGHGYSLDLADLYVGTLPAINGDFSHVYSLILENMGLQTVPEGFLRSFSRLEELELHNNRFTEIPAEVGLITDLNTLTLDSNELLDSPTMFSVLRNLNDLQLLVLSNNPIAIPAPAANALSNLRALTMLSLEGLRMDDPVRVLAPLQRLPNLTSLWLRDNDIVMTPAIMECLTNLHGLEHLDLSNNPLGAQLDVRSLTDLGVLNLRDCGLTQWPAGLTTLMNQRPPVLRSIGLEGNPIAEVPVLAGLPFFTETPFPPQPLRIHAAAMSEVGRARLLAAGVLARDLAPVTENWRTQCPEPVLAMAQQLRGEADSRFFFEAIERVQETAEYRRDHAAGRQRVWNLIRALAEPDAGDDGQGLEHLRRQVFRIGDEAINTCGDGIELLLNRSETLVMAHRAGLNAATAAHGLRDLLTLGRQLFRADLLDHTVIQVVQRRMDRRAFLMGAADSAQVSSAQWRAINEQSLASAPALYPGDNLTHVLLRFEADEVEIRLAMRLALREILDLQPQPQHLRYPEPVADSLRDQVASDVRGEDTDAGFLDWLEDQPFWSDTLVRRYQTRFDALDQQWQQGLLYLFEISRSEPQPEPVAAQVLEVLTGILGDRGWYRDGQMQVVKLTDDEQEIARQALTAGQLQARRALARQLSEQALQGEHA